MKALIGKAAVKARGILIIPHFVENQEEGGKDMLRENKNYGYMGRFLGDSTRKKD